MRHGMAEKKLSTFALVLITVGSVDNIRNIPSLAMLHEHLLLYLFLGAFLFLIPSAIASGFLAKKSNNHQGLFGWVNETLGHGVAKNVVILQWLENVCCFPAFLSFIVATFLSLFDPGLTQSKWLFFSLMISTFWALSYLNIKNFHHSIKLSMTLTLIGLILPFLLIIGLGVFAYVKDILPIPAMTFQLNQRADTLPVLVAVMLSFCGIEIAASLLYRSHQPEKSYPKAITLSTVIIFFSLLLATWVVSAALKQQSINLASGTIETINLLLAVFHLEGLKAIVALLIVLGCVACTNNWLLAPLENLHFALMHSVKSTRRSLKAPLIILQALLVTGLSVLFLYQSINGAYWLLTVMATQIYMLMYFLLFLTALKKAMSLGVKKHFVVCLSSLIGIVSTLTTIMIGFIPPKLMHQSTGLFITELLTVFVLFFLATRFVFKRAINFQTA